MAVSFNNFPLTSASFSGVLTPSMYTGEVTPSSNGELVKLRTEISELRTKVAMLEVQTSPDHLALPNFPISAVQARLLSANRLATDVRVIIDEINDAIYFGKTKVEIKKDLFSSSLRLNLNCLKSKLYKEGYLVVETPDYLNISWK